MSNYIDKIKSGGNEYDIRDTSIEANIEAETTEELSNLKIGDTTYEIPKVDLPIKQTETGITYQDNDGRPIISTTTGETIDIYMPNGTTKVIQIDQSAHTITLNAPTTLSAPLTVNAPIATNVGLYKDMSTPILVGNSSNTTLYGTQTRPQYNDGSNTTDIALTSDLEDHETRITNLENASSGGSANNEYKLYSTSNSFTLGYSNTLNDDTENLIELSFDNAIDFSKQYYYILKGLNTETNEYITFSQGYTQYYLYLEAKVLQCFYVPDTAWLLLVSGVGNTDYSKFTLQSLYLNESITMENSIIELYEVPMNLSA